MSKAHPDRTPQATANGSLTNGAAPESVAGPPPAGGRRGTHRRRPPPAYTRTEVAEALTEITDQVRARGRDLPPVEWQRLDLPFRTSFPQLFVRDMSATSKVLIGLLWLPLVGIGSFVALLWSYPLAERAQADGARIAVHWIGPDFHVTPTTAVLLTMAFAACSGSVIQAAAVFAIRAGNHTLERGYEAWYYLRPITSLLLGPLFGLATVGGLTAITSGAGAAAPPSLPALVTAGTLAGLFTDRVLQQMQRILGATDPDRHASQQETPWTPTASTTPDKTGAGASMLPGAGKGGADTTQSAGAGPGEASKTKPFEAPVSHSLKRTRKNDKSGRTPAKAAPAP